MHTQLHIFLFLTIIGVLPVVKEEVMPEGRLISQTGAETSCLIKDTGIDWIVLRIERTLGEHISHEAFLLSAKYYILVRIHLDIIITAAHAFSRGERGDLMLLEVRDEGAMVFF